MPPSYFNRYENLAMERTDTGILTLRFHTDGGPLIFTGQTHRDLPKALAEIGDDRDNKVVILTGSGAVFMEAIDGASLGEIFKPGEWDKIYWEGRRVLQRLLQLEAPLIAAINGPATVHSEYALLSDLSRNRRIRYRVRYPKDCPSPAAVVLLSQGGLGGHMATGSSRTSVPPSPGSASWQ